MHRALKNAKKLSSICFFVASMFVSYVISASDLLALCKFVLSD